MLFLIVFKNISQLSNELSRSAILCLLCYIFSFLFSFYFIKNKIIIILTKQRILTYIVSYFLCVVSGILYGLYLQNKTDSKAIFLALSILILICVSLAFLFLSRNNQYNSIFVQIIISFIPPSIFLGFFQTNTDYSLLLAPMVVFGVQITCIILGSKLINNERFSNK